jgi:hypothetical protein
MVGFQVAKILFDEFWLTGGVKHLCSIKNLSGPGSVELLQLLPQFELKCLAARPNNHEPGNKTRQDAPGLQSIQKTLQLPHHLPLPFTSSLSPALSLHSTQIYTHSIFLTTATAQTPISTTQVVSFLKNLFKKGDHDNDTHLNHPTQPSKPISQQDYTSGTTEYDPFPPSPSRLKHC